MKTFIQFFMIFIILCLLHASYIIFSMFINREINLANILLLELLSLGLVSFLVYLIYKLEI